MREGTAQRATEAVGRGLQPGECLCSVRGVVACSRVRSLSAIRWAAPRKDSGEL